MDDVVISIGYDEDDPGFWGRLADRLDGAGSHIDDMTDSLDEVHDRLDGRSGKGQKSLSFSKSLSESFKKMFDIIGKGAKLSMKAYAIELLAAGALMATTTLLFKTGSFWAKAYAGSLNLLGYAFNAAAAAAAVFFAAQSEFQSVQFAPRFTEGVINASDKFQAASSSMKMFVTDAELAVIGTKGLTSAFNALSRNAPVTGETLSTFKAMSNFVAGMGGDMEKNAGAMAEFLSQFAKDKRMTTAVENLGKKMGPDFEKIMKEARKKGLTSYADFTKAAQQGELGETFAKYAGQLDAINGTLIGSFKQSISTLKAQFTELGTPMLGPMKEALTSVTRSIEVLIGRITTSTQNFANNTLLGDLVGLIDKVTVKLGNIMTRDMSKVADNVQSILAPFRWMARTFEKAQDYFREFKEGGQVILDLLSAFGGSAVGQFTVTLERMNNYLVENRDRLLGFVDQLMKLYNSFKENFAIPLAKFVVEILDNLKGIRQLVELMGFFIKLILAPFKLILNLAELLIDKFGMVGRVLGGLLTLFAAAAAFAVLKVIKTGVVNVFTNKMPGGDGKLITKDRLKKGKDAWDRFRAGRAAAKAARAGGGGGGAGGAAGAAGTGTAIAGAASVVGTVLGSALAGYGAGSLSARMFNKDDSVKSRLGSAAVGAAGGALAGAGIGAALTSWGGPLAGVGAAVGAVIGAVVGGITGYIKAGKLKKEARAAANKIINDYRSSFDEAVKKGDIDAIKKAQMVAMRERQKMLEKGGFSESEMRKKDKEFAQLNRQVKTYLQNAADVETFLGQDADKLNEIAEIMGKDATKGVINLFDAMKQGLVDITPKWRELMGEFNAGLIAATYKIFEGPKAMTEAQKAVDAAQQKILEQGGANQKDITDFLKKLFEYGLAKTGGDALAARALMKNVLEQSFGKGGNLDNGLRDIQDAFLSNDAYNQLYDSSQMLKDVAVLQKYQLQGQLVENITGGKMKASDYALAAMRVGGTMGESGLLAMDKLLNSVVQMQTTPQEMLATLGRENGLAAWMVSQAARERGAAISADRAAKAGKTGSTTTYNVPTLTPTKVNVNNTEIVVSGFISDKATAEYIAQLIAAENANRTNRAGAFKR